MKPEPAQTIGRPSLLRQLGGLSIAHQGHTSLEHLAPCWRNSLSSPWRCAG